nr:retrotransposon protein, putative, Ty1-copia subclass [Tanacetum cinerariifolium]
MKRKVESKLTGLKSATKDLDHLIGSQRSDKIKEGLGYSVVPPPSAQVYSPPKKDMSWTGLPEFVDDTVTDYSRPSPAIKSTTNDVQNRNPSVLETEASPSTISEVNTARPKAVINRRNWVNDVKPSACWVWKPVKPNSASIILKRYDYINVKGRSRSVMAWVPKKGRNVGNKMIKSFPLPVMEFPLPEQFPTASEDMFPLLFMELKALYSKQAEQELLQTVREFYASPKSNNPPPPKKDNPVKDAICHQCGGVGHLRSNYLIYLAELLKKKKLSQGASTLVSVSKNNIVYFSAIPRDGIYEIDLSLSNTNDSSIKMARKPNSHQVERAKDLLDLIHTDVCGPFRIVLRQGSSYFVFFTDDFSRYGYVYVLKHKHEVFETFKMFQKDVENQLEKTIKSLRSDRRGKYLSQEFLDHLKDHGIISHYTPPYMPNHNGVSRRRNRTLLNMVRPMISQTTLPKSFWDYALESAARSVNMIPTKKIEKTPYEIWHGQGPKLFYLKDTQRKRWDILSTTHPRTNDAEEPELGDLGEPTNYKAALLDPEFEKWLAAMKVEMQSMNDNEFWELVDLPPNTKSVAHKWLFKKKTDIDGAVHTFKSRLVVKGFTQTYRVDYEETFSPVAYIRAIKILIAIAAYYDYEIWQMDPTHPSCCFYNQAQPMLLNPDPDAPVEVLYNHKSHPIDGVGWCGCGVVAAVVVGLKEVVARVGEWCGGSYRSGEGECFRGSPEKFSNGRERR